MYGQVANYENKFYVNGQEILGIESLDISYSHSATINKYLGFNGLNGNTSVSGPVTQKVSITRNLIYSDPLIGYITNNNSFISSSADSNRVIIKPRIEVTLQGNNKPMSLLFRIASNSTIVYDIRNSFLAPISPTLITWDVNIPPEYANPLSSYRYEFYIESYGTYANVNLKPGGVISLLQDPSITIIGSPYWTTGSSSNILVATSSMYSALTQTQIFPTSSGYYSNLPFTLQKLDEIRFEGDENQTYVILDPDYSTGTSTRGNLTLLLDRNITPGTDLNSFFLRRYIPDPNFILIDVPGSEASGNGFLFPEYTSLDIQNNFDNIIQNLKAKGVIPS